MMTPTHQENDPMSDQSTRARTPDADPRIGFILGQEDAQALYAAAQLGLEATNAWWLEAGQRLGFVWTTVQELHWAARPRDDAGETQAQDVNGATFTAWPETPAAVDFTDALSWADAECERLATAGPIPAPFRATLDTDMFTRDFVLRAFNAGSDHGFAMGVATVPDPGLGWDGMELIRESAELLRSYEASHRAKFPHLFGDARQADALARDTDAKADRNAAQAEKLEAFLADPAQSHLVHDGLREARGDAALGVIVGWEAALIEVRNLVESGRANAGSAIPPLVLLSRLAELEAPEDMDEVLGPWRGVTEGIARIADMRGEKPAWAMTITGGGWSRADHLRWAGDAVRAWREFHDKSDWVREAIRMDVPKSLGMPSQLGRHTMDTARAMVGQLNNLLAQALDGTIAGLRVQAAADVLQAMGVTGRDADAPIPPHVAMVNAGTPPVPENPELDAHFHGDAGTRDPGAAGAEVRPEGVVRTSHRYPVAEGLECMGKPCDEQAAPEAPNDGA